MLSLISNVVNVLNVKQKKPKLQNTLPPENPPIPNDIGPFCIKAFCEIPNVANFSGFDTDYEIIKKTQDVCNSFSEGYNSSKCSEPVISIAPMKDLSHCEKHIVIYNNLSNSTSIMFPN